MRGATVALALLLAAPAHGQDTMTDKMKAAGALAGLSFTDAELKGMVRGAAQNLRAFELMRKRPLPNALAPALTFSPFAPGVTERPSGLEDQPLILPAVELPADLEQLAFANIPVLASVIKSRAVSCEALTRMYLARLRKLDESLKCVISYTEERALAQAKALDAELAAGKWRGPLHGIPYGAKDLFAAKGAKTTWGAAPFKDQVIDADAEVIRKLDAAGAVLIAKLTLGALAMGDVWYGGRTNNPWNVAQGSSGSSAGSAAATAAGGVAFALGTETLGSIVSPSDRCGCSSLRPTFGRVSREGAMSLSWSMDKVGPICRSAADASLVFAAIHGDAKRPFAVALDADVKGWRVGYFERVADRVPEYRKVLEQLKALGCTLVPATLPRYPVGAMRIILFAEAAAAFDDLTRSGDDDKLVRQTADAWPNLFRVARLVPAVEYIQANRLRAQMMADVDAAWKDFDFLVHPPYYGGLLTLFNLTGHPTAVAPAAFREGRPASVSITGRLMWDDRLLALVHAWQRTTDWHLRRPTKKER